MGVVTKSQTNKPEVETEVRRTSLRIKVKQIAKTNQEKYNRLNSGKKENACDNNLGNITVNDCQSLVRFNGHIEQSSIKPAKKTQSAKIKPIANPVGNKPSNYRTNKQMANKATTQSNNKTNASNSAQPAAAAARNDNKFVTKPHPQVKYQSQYQVVPYSLNPPSLARNSANKCNVMERYVYKRSHEPEPIYVNHKKYKSTTLVQNTTTVSRIAYWLHNTPQQQITVHQDRIYESRNIEVSSAKKHDAPPLQKPSQATGKMPTPKITPDLKRLAMEQFNALQNSTRSTSSNAQVSNIESKQKRQHRARSNNSVVIKPETRSVHKIDSNTVTALQRSSQQYIVANTVSLPRMDSRQNIGTNKVSKQGRSLKNINTANALSLQSSSQQNVSTNKVSSRGASSLQNIGSNEASLQRSHSLKNIDTSIALPLQISSQENIGNNIVSSRQLSSRQNACSKSSFSLQAPSLQNINSGKFPSVEARSLQNIDTNELSLVMIAPQNTDVSNVTTPPPPTTHSEAPNSSKDLNENVAEDNKPEIPINSTPQTNNFVQIELKRESKTNSIDGRVDDVKPNSFQSSHCSEASTPSTDTALEVCPSFDRNGAVDVQKSLAAIENLDSNVMQKKDGELLSVISFDGQFVVIQEKLVSFWSLPSSLFSIFGMVQQYVCIGKTERNNCGKFC